MPRNVKTSFNAGEFSPRLYGRVDLKKYANGCKTMINYIPMPHGGATRRSGFKYINDTKTHSKLSRLIPFQFSTEQAYIIEAGDLYMRFYKDGGQIQGVDSNTKLLLHFEGTEASQTIIDDGTDSLTVTAQNDAQIDTSQAVFTGSSCTFSKYGSEDYIYFADSDSWNYASGAFTIDFRVRFREANGIHCLYYQPDTTALDIIAIYYDFETRRFYFHVRDGGSWVIKQVLGSDAATSLVANTWYHVALIRGWGGGSNDWALILNGSSVFTFTDSSAMPDHDQAPRIGASTNSTIFDFGETGHTITVSGSAAIDKTYSKFGRGSIKFNAGSDYLSLASHNYWQVTNYTNYTIDLFVRFNSHSGLECMVSQYYDGDNYWYLGHADGTGLQFAFVYSDDFYVYLEGTEINDSNWHHVALCKVGYAYGLYLDGQQVGWDASAVNAPFTASLYVAALGAYRFSGQINNLRIHHGNPFSALPNSGETDTIEVPTRYHLPDTSTKLLIYGEPKNLDGWIDEYRISKGTARWTAAFSPPSLPYPAGDDSGTTYEIVTTYTEEELANLKWTQSADILYIVSPDRMPRKLTRTGHTSWTISDLTFDDENWPPFLDKNITDITIDASAITGAITLTASSPLFDTNMVGGYFALKDGYCKVTGFTSTTVVNATVIKGLTDHDATADWWEGAWSDYRGWPTSVTFYEDRLGFGGPGDSPDRIDLSVTRDYENFYRAELDGGTAAADDAIGLYLSSRQINAVRWMAGTRKLLVGTSGGEWWIDGGGTDEALDATSTIRRKMDTEHGSADTNCILIGSRVIFLQRLSRILRDFYYDWQEDQYQANNLSVLSEHLTNRVTITELAWQQSPHQLLWATLSNGTLLSITYMREQEVVGWARHSVAGSSAIVESITVIEGATEDELWAIIRRNINGSVKRYVEKMEPLVVVDTGESGAGDWELSDSFYIDSGLTYRGASTDTVSGLDHLEGETVIALADGVVETGLVVSGGTVTLSRTASVVHIGLNFYSDLEGLWPINQDSEGLMLGYPQRLTNTILMLYRSLGGQIGPNEYNLSDIIYPAYVGVGANERVTRDGDRRIVRGGDVRIIRGGGTSTPDYYTGLTMDMSIKGGNECYPTVYIRQAEPLPLTITACIVDIE